MFVDILSIPAHARTHTLTRHVRIKVQSTQSVGMAGVPADAVDRVPRSKFWQNGGQWRNVYSTLHEPPEEIMRCKGREVAIL